jgi:hypothetical protein
MQDAGEGLSSLLPWRGGAPAADFREIRSGRFPHGKMPDPMAGLLHQHYSGALERRRGSRKDGV